jgi:hypothetical protein
MALTIRICVKTDLYNQTKRSTALCAVKAAISHRSIQTKNGTSLKLGLWGNTMDDWVSTSKNILSNTLLSVREKA